MNPAVWFCGSFHQPLGESSRFADGDGLAVGWFDDIDFDEFTLQLNKGDRLFLYSDDALEAMDSKLEQLSNERKLVEIDKGSSKQIDEQVQDLRAVVDQWCKPKGPCDDVSILAIEIR